MIFNHLETAEMNYKKGYKNIQIFEIGPIYNTSQSQENILSLFDKIKSSPMYFLNLEYV